MRIRVTFVIMMMMFASSIVQGRPNIRKKRWDFGSFWNIVKDSVGQTANTVSEHVQDVSNTALNVARDTLEQAKDRVEDAYQDSRGLLQKAVNSRPG